MTHDKLSLLQAAQSMGHANNFVLSHELHSSLKILVRRAYHDYGGECEECLKGRINIVTGNTSKRMKLTCRCNKRTQYRDSYKQWITWIATSQT